VSSSGSCGAPRSFVDGFLAIVSSDGGQKKKDRRFRWNLPA
jgi:hypothetical protein